MVEETPELLGKVVKHEDGGAVLGMRTNFVPSDISFFFLFSLQCVYWRLYSIAVPVFRFSIKHIGCEECTWVKYHSRFLCLDHNEALNNEVCIKLFSNIFVLVYYVKLQK